jgi:hypothetical protein
VPERGVELEDLHLRGNDPDEQHTEQRNPDPAADQAVEQRVVGQRSRERQRAIAQRQARS